MANDLDEQDIVENLRAKAEVIDVEQYLKAALGGYTKKSVLDYLSLLRKQQQQSADTFARNLQSVYNEKEEISQAKEALQSRLNKLESEYQNLSQAMATFQLENETITPQDILALKNTILALEEEQKRNAAEKNTLLGKNEQLKNEIAGLQADLAQAGEQMNGFREMLLTEKQEAKKLRDRVAESSLTITDKLNEIQYLKSVMSEGEMARLSAKISDLTQQLMAQTEVMAKQNASMQLQAQTMERLNAQGDAQKKKINELAKTKEELQMQNEKLQAMSRDLGKQLEAEYKKAIEMIGEKSAITVEKITAHQKLANANAKIAMLEMQLQKEDKEASLQEAAAAL